MMTHKGIEDWAEQLEEDLITFDGLDSAIVGIVQVHTLPSRVVYSYEKIIDELVSEGSTFEDAQEYFEFNIACLWAGDNTPAIVYSAGDAESGLGFY